jgi:hypothetical protein
MARSMLLTSTCTSYTETTKENARQWRMPPDNVYGDVPPTEAWRKQEREICHN